MFSSTALVDTKWQGNLTSDTFSSIEVVKQYYLKMCRGSVASNSDEYIQFPDTLEDSDPDSELMYTAKCSFQRRARIAEWA